MALMHAIGTTLAFWIHTIIRETKVAIRLKNDKKGEDDDEALSMNPFLLECEGPNTLNTIYRNFSPYLYPFVIEYSILMVGIFYMIYANINKCPRRKEAKKIYDSNQQDSSTSNNSTSESNDMDENEIADHFQELSEHDGHFNNNLIVYADCHAANKGLFSGLILLVLTIVFVILFFVAASNE